MEKIIYRELRESDYIAIEHLIADSFGFGNYFPDETILTEIKHAYLQSCLSEQTYCCVAEKSGTVVGVIMGNAQKHYHVTDHLKPLQSTLWHILYMRFLAKRKGVQLNDYDTLHHIYRKLLSGRYKEYDGVLTLFAVDKNCRGFGIGTELLQRLEEYYEVYKIHKIYLYTDSSCNTAFYDRHGFRCVEKQDLSMEHKDGRIILEVFLYEKRYIQ